MGLEQNASSRASAAVNFPEGHFKVCQQQNIYLCAFESNDIMPLIADVCCSGNSVSLSQAARSYMLVVMPGTSSALLPGHP